MSDSVNAKVYCEIKDSIAHLFFDHPKARNAMTQAMYEQLRTICLEPLRIPRYVLPFCEGLVVNPLSPVAILRNFNHFKLAPMAFTTRA